MTQWQFDCEVLTHLPLEGVAMPVSMIAKELRCYPGAVRAAINRWKRRGIRIVHAGKSQGGPGVSVAHDSWRRVQTEAFLHTQRAKREAAA